MKKILLLALSSLSVLQAQDLGLADANKAVFTTIQESISILTDSNPSKSNRLKKLQAKLERYTGSDNKDIVRLGSNSRGLLNSLTDALNKSTFVSSSMWADVLALLEKENALTLIDMLKTSNVPDKYLFNPLESINRQLMFDAFDAMIEKQGDADEKIAAFNTYIREKIAQTRPKKPSAQVPAINIIGSPDVYAHVQLHDGTIVALLKPTATTEPGYVTFPGIVLTQHKGMQQVTGPFFLANPIMSEERLLVKPTLVIPVVRIAHVSIIKALMPLISNLQVVAQTSHGDVPLKLESINFETKNFVYNNPFSDNAQQTIVVTLRTSTGRLTQTLTISPRTVGSEKEVFNIPFDFLRPSSPDAQAGASAAPQEEQPINIKLLTRLISDADEDVQLLLPIVSKLAQVREDSLHQTEDLLTSPLVFEYLLSIARLMVTLKKLGEFHLENDPSGFVTTLHESINYLINDPKKLKPTLERIAASLRSAQEKYHLRPLPSERLQSRFKDFSTTVENSFKKYTTRISADRIQTQEVLVFKQILQEVSEKNEYDQAVLQKLESLFVNTMSNEAQRHNNTKLDRIIKRFQGQPNALAMIAAAIKQEGL